MVLLIAAVGPAQAQLRLPIAPPPALPVQKLTQAVGQAGNSLQQLSEVRRLGIARLIRDNPHTIGADPLGNPIIRDELLAYSPSSLAIATSQSLGFKILREQAVGELDMHLFVLQPPAAMKLPEALRRLRAADPAGTYDFNHIYTGSGGSSVSAPIEAPSLAATGSSGAGVVPRVGLIDSGVDTAHPAFRDAVIHRWGCGGRFFASAHATAVASLLIGQDGGFRGVLAKAELYAADVYCNAPTGGAVDALAAGFAWLAQQHIGVINVSLVGPDNAALAQIVRALTARGYVLVAAVGNDGPAAPPLYPASYPHVVGVTAVDAHRRVLIEAARGSQVMFAAPGADMAAADIGGKYSSVRGTSFAAPIVAGLLAQSVTAPDANVSGAAIDSLVREAIDLGTTGRDLTYGFGLVGAAYRNDPKPLAR
jgi:subtilisin family serine protease